MSRGTSFAGKLKRARAGDRNAQFAVARAYMYGVGVKEDVEHALSWLRTAAEAGHRGAQVQLADQLCGAADDDGLSQAAAWYARAAEQDDAYAQVQLGRMHLDGRGIEQDPRRAASLFYAATCAGNAEARRLLVNLFAGDADGSTSEIAARWLKDQAEQGDAGAQYQYAVRCWDDAGTEGARAVAAAYLDKAAAQGHAHAQHRLAEILWAGHDAPMDRARALDLYRAAAAQGIAEARAALIQLHLWGATPGVTLEEALRLMTEESFWGTEAAALSLLGDRYLTGNGVAPDPVKAERYIRQAAEAGSPDAQLTLGQMHLTGKGCALDPVQAERWLTRAAESIYCTDDARLDLGRLYLNGAAGIPADPDKARHWLEQVDDPEMANVWLDSGTEAGVHLAAEWLRGAVDRYWGWPQGHSTTRTLAAACYKLGQCYCSGHIVARDLAEGVKWLSRARHYDDALATQVAGDLDRIYALELGRSPGAIADLGFAVGKAFLEGLHEEDERRQAQVTLWWRAAAERGHAEAQFRLALFLLHEPGGGHAEAVTWVDLTGEAELADAPSTPADESEGEHELGASVAEGFTWLRRAADQGHAGARQRLGLASP